MLSFFGHYTQLLKQTVKAVAVTYHREESMSG